MSRATATALPLRFRYRLAVEQLRRFPARARLYYGIGRVAQDNVSVELRLRSIWSTLVYQGHGADLKASLVNRDKQPRQTGDVIQACKEMLAANDATLTEGVRDAADLVFQAITDAQTMRHRVVHDLWIYADDGTSVPGWRRFNPDFTSAGILSATVGLDYVHAALRAATVAQAQVDDLFLLLWHELGIAVGGTPSLAVPDLVARIQQRKPGPAG